MNKSIAIKVVKKIEGGKAVLYIALPDNVMRAINFQTQKNSTTDYKSDYTSGKRRKICPLLHDISSANERCIFDVQFLNTGRIVLNRPNLLEQFNRDFKGIIAKVLYIYDTHKHKMKKMTARNLRKARGD